DGQQAAVGCFGGAWLAGLFGQFGGKKCIFGLFLGQLESFEKVVGSLGGIVAAIDLGQSAPCAGFCTLAGFARIEPGCRFQLRVRVVEYSLAGQQQSEQQVRLEAVGIGVDGAAIKASGFAGFVLGIGYVSGVEEGAGVL